MLEQQNFVASATLSATESGTVKKIKSVVTAGGGNWVGIQTTIDGPPLILFSSPQTGSTLALYYSELWTDLDLAKTVSERIKESDAEFADRKIKVKASTLTRFADTLSQVVTELNELITPRKNHESK